MSAAGGSAAASEPSQTDERVRFERLIADLSARFVNLPAADVGAHIVDALRSITEFLDMDRGFLIEVREGSDELPVTWRFIGDLPLLGHRFAVHQYPWYAGRIRAGQAIVLPRLPDDLPLDSHEARQTFVELNIKTSVTVPVKIGGVVLGAICFCSHRASRDWPDELVQRLVVVGEIFASALERKRLDEQLSQRLEFEALLTEVSSSLTHVPAERVDAAIEAGLSRLVTFLEVDRASVYEFSPDGTASPTHSFSSATDHGRPEPAMVDAFPYGMQALRRGEPVRVVRVDALPAEAAADRAALEAMGIGAALVIPVRANEVLACALALSMSRPGREWPEAMIPRLRLIAETFANAVARKRADQQLAQALTEVRQLKDRLAAENVYLQEQIGRESGSQDIIGASDALKYVLFRLEQVAATGATVLLLGETGTGKSLAARAIHARSPRKERPLITINCAALPANLVESELFGHERGAFTGALTRRPGRFELADGGTLFLDEIGDLPLELQAKLLRVLQDGEFERVGGSQTLRVNVRIIASTNRELRADVQQGRFRQDLYYRLNVFPDLAAGPAPTERGHPGTGAAPGHALRAGDGPPNRDRPHAGHARAPGIRLAGEHPRVGERDRAGRDYQPRSGAPAGGTPRGGGRWCPRGGGRRSSERSREAAHFERPRAHRLEDRGGQGCRLDSRAQREHASESDATARHQALLTPFVISP